MDPVLTIGEVARRSGVASSALRFYEERGLIASVRAGSGHRRYPRSVLRRVAFIVFAQRIGLTLEEIGAELAKLPANRSPTREDWARLSAGWKKRVDQRIAELQTLRDGLTQCIGCAAFRSTSADWQTRPTRQDAADPAHATGSADRAPFSMAVGAARSASSFSAVRSPSSGA
jgi:MerR family transcriptional regulator, redox-sensitive transcriptional activator SoxR